MKADIKNDERLKKYVADELMWDLSTNATTIGVTVKEGVVTLSGHLSSYAEKHATERAAWRVSGVKGVAVEIDVNIPGSFKRTDEDIAKSALDAIYWHVWIPKDSVNVRVENGWITLSGNVEYEYQRNAVKKAVLYLQGVRGVDNEIRIKSSISGVDIKTKIQEALQRRANEEMKAITIAVNGNEVTLTGTIPTYSQRRVAVNTAQFTPGVTKVTDNMVISA